MDFETIKDHIKGAFKSWTMWFNGVVASLLAAAPILQDFAPQIGEYLTGGMLKNLMGLVLIGNILLRIKTTKPLNEK
jgi:hypothetical protein